MMAGSGRRGVVRLAVAATCALALAGCESGRFGGGPVVASARPGPREAVQDPMVVASVPSGSVIAEPLAPPPGSSPSVPVMPGSPQPVETIGGGGGGGGPVPAMSRGTAVGSWTAREASGSSCRVNLSSAPSLDLYRASAAGCTNKDLGKITAWDFRDGEVYLYQPGGAVAARLRAGDGSLSGVLSKSGAPLTLTRA